MPCEYGSWQSGMLSVYGRGGLIFFVYMGHGDPVSGMLCVYGPASWYAWCICATAIWYA